MRAKIITIIGCLLLVAGISAVEQLSVHRIVHKALDETREIRTDIRAGLLEEAENKAHALNRTWDEEARMIEMLVDHGPTDDVRYALSKLLAALEGGDRAAALVYASELEGGIERVHERQVITMENLL